MAKKLMREVDELLRAGEFEAVDRLLSTDEDYSVRQRLALLTMTLYAGDKLTNRAAFYDHSVAVITRDRGAHSATRLLSGLDGSQ
jgi:hypothetical protein